MRTLVHTIARAIQGTRGDRVRRGKRPRRARSTFVPVDGRLRALTAD
ncbi:hypothetical protein NQ152_05570 [Microbacterium sp. zg.B48]|nr:MULTISPECIES: hypothetical protein [unclassified Microbacterium]MCR2762975.1 hypothetical protein [Microbacterium sp. zg.B48]MCR2808561.1 hypothetical protein [Microbacterium sp. zg.B185]WIM19001.1 hypothetical protein QNO12_15680 [Microbacterium sp. zg-B185]